MRGDRETTFGLDQLDYLTKHIAIQNEVFGFSGLRPPSRFVCYSILSLSLPLSFNLFEQLIDSLALFLNAIAHEMKLGRAGQIQRKTELLANIRRRVSQRREHFLVLFFITGNGHVNASCSFVLREPNVRHRHQTRIFEFITDDLTDLFSQSIRVSLRPPHNKPRVRSPRPVQRYTLQS